MTVKYALHVVEMKSPLEALLRGKRQPISLVSKPKKVCLRREVHCQEKIIMVGTIITMTITLHWAYCIQIIQWWPKIENENHKSAFSPPCMLKCIYIITLTLDYRGALNLNWTYAAIRSESITCYCKLFLLPIG